MYRYRDFPPSYLIFDKMKNKKTFFILVIVLIIGGILFYNIFNKSPEVSTNPEEEIEKVKDDIIIDEPPVNIESGKIIGIKDEKKEWLIEAETITIAEDRISTSFEEIKQMIIYKDDEPHLTIVAENCVANMQSKDMELNGNVIISNEEGDSLMGEKIYWHSEDQRLSSPDEVELKVDEHYIVAGGISSNMEMTNIELINRVTVTMKL